MTKTAVKEKTKEEYLIVYEDGTTSDTLTLEQLFQVVNSERTDYINDGVDPEYIEEYFPADIETLDKAKEWLKGMGCLLLVKSDKLNESQRILKRIFDNNGKITGTLKSKEQDYFDQGSWKFTLTILDIDDNMKMRLQLSSIKLCPSGAWDNGIKVVAHPETSLYVFDRGIETTVSTIIKRYFRSDRGKSGYNYKLENFEVNID